MNLPPFWQLIGFSERLEIWASQQQPSDDLVNVVTHWAFSRYEDPYLDVRRHPDVAPNYWWGPIPGTIHGDLVVVCGYRIHEVERTVQCDNFATLSLPL